MEVGSESGDGSLGAPPVYYAREREGRSIFTANVMRIYSAYMSVLVSSYRED